jgi:hypothetical protein
MTHKEFEKRMVECLADAMKSGLLHQVAFMANTSDAHMILTNMGRQTAMSFVLHMLDHMVRGGGGFTAYNIITGEELEISEDEANSGNVAALRRKRTN